MYMEVFGLLTNLSNACQQCMNAPSRERLHALLTCILPQFALKVINYRSQCGRLYHVLLYGMEGTFWNRLFIARLSLNHKLMHESEREHYQARTCIAMQCICTHDIAINDTLSQIKCTYRSGHRNYNKK